MNGGTICYTDSNGNNPHLEHSFYKIEARLPTTNSMIKTSSGRLIGTTPFGGRYNLGILFEYIPATNTYVKLNGFVPEIEGGAMLRKNA